MNEMEISNLIDLYYSSAVKGIKEEWFSNKEYDKWYEYVIKLPQKEKIVYLVVILDEEVSRGGLNQYFINRYGQFVKETIEVLNLIDANSTAAILEKAYKLINNENINYSHFRKKLVLNDVERLYNDDDLNDYLETLNDEYNEYNDNIGALLGKYLKTD